MKYFLTAAIAFAVLALAGFGIADAWAFDLTAELGRVPFHMDVITATAMMTPLNARARGLYGVRADAGTAEKILAELQKTFEEFKAEREAELKGIDAKFADVVQTEKVDRINAEITNLQKSLDEVNASLAALRLGGGAGEPVNAAVAEYNKAFNSWFRRGDRAGVADLGDLAVKAALTTDSNPDGGYLVTPEMDSEITRVLGTVSAMRGLSRVITISSHEYRKLVNMGGTGSGWVGERESRPETDTAVLRELIFQAMEIYANPAVTQRALDDPSFNIEQWLGDEVAIEFAEQEGAAFITGDGVSKPRGMIGGYDTVADSAYAWGKLGFIATGGAAGFASSNPADAIIDLYYALKAGYRNGASFLISDAVMGTVRKFKDGQGNYLWAPPTGVDMPATILGKPAVTDDNMPALGANAIPMAFGNYNRGYLIVDRMGARVLRDPFTNKPYVHFYTTKQVGGGVQNFEAIKLLKCAT